MVKHTNVYETIKEAEMRLRYTLIMYDGEPYYVLAVGDHHKDGIFRIYLDKGGNPDGFAFQRPNPPPYSEHGDLIHDPKNLDKWLEENPDKGVIRKMMNSPLFGGFAPFPLGMVNFGGSIIYTERQPVRHTQQGLTDSMIKQSKITLSPNGPGTFKYGHVSSTTYQLYDTIKGNYPTPDECLLNLLNPLNTNEGVAFHRQFALLKGPVGTLFLAYKNDVVGVLLDESFRAVKLDPAFRYTKEVIEGLNLFDEVIIRRD